MDDRPTHTARWKIDGDDVEVTVGVVDAGDGDGPRVLLGLEHTASLRFAEPHPRDPHIWGTAAEFTAPIQADGWLTDADVDVLVERLLAAKAQAWSVEQPARVVA